MEDLKKELKEKLKLAQTLNQVDFVKSEFLGKNSVLGLKMDELKSMSVEEKKVLGKSLNAIKNEFSDIVNSRREEVLSLELEKKILSESIDITIPGRKNKIGSIHPISQAIEEMLAIFSFFGFDFVHGSNIEDDWHNFTALNVPEHHPARQMQDTFYFSDRDRPISEFDSVGNPSCKGMQNKSVLNAHEDSSIKAMQQQSTLGLRRLLRTHTSTVQIRAMKNAEPPFRFVSVGRVYRSDSDATHTPMFHQIEGVVLSEDTTFAHLKGFLQEFINTFFEKEVKLRFRPSFFPFTEPSAEVDISMKGDDNWLEVLGSGMIHPNVLSNVGIDSKKYRGFAFGLGVERFLMLKYGIDDLRSLFSVDLRFVEKYNFSAFDIPNIIRGLTR